MNFHILQYADHRGLPVSASANFQGGFHVVRFNPFAGKNSSMNLQVTEEQLDLYYNDKHLVQQVFPNLTNGEREFLMSGITPESWEKTFSPR